jgi:hypothetical protein
MRSKPAFKYNMVGKIKEKPVVSQDWMLHHACSWEEETHVWEKAGDTLTMRRRREGRGAVESHDTHLKASKWSGV